MRNEFSLAPGISPVAAAEIGINRFNGLSPAGNPLKRLESFALFFTRLKPGANVRSHTVFRFCDTQ
jgi:hypothetical protein